MKEDKPENDPKDFFYKKIEEIAKIDHCRLERAGKPEAVFAEFKEPEDVIKICNGYLESSGEVLITRTSPDITRLIKKEFDKNQFEIKTNKKGRTIVIRDKNKVTKQNEAKKKGKIAIITAGTSDIPVAEEAASTAEFLDLEVLRYYDIGVAGLHRIVEPLRDICKEDVRAIISVAGMEGALPSVIAGLVAIPVIAVPTSVGYGTNLGGLTTLFAMLQSCSSGVAVVNIDNGFGAAVFASLIIRKN